jgi:uncharacterized protein YgbK (DUF1537 family)
MKLGCVADDYTGATDLAGLLRRSGASVKLHFGLPEAPSDRSADIEIIALKCRTEPVDKAVHDCSHAARWLLAGGAERLYWKYCSTFDSTPQGNIGPVAEALMVITGQTRALYCPAFPENGRSVFMGHLFVGDQLLSESSMKDHPLTPMRDANLAHVLAPQVKDSVGIWNRVAQKSGHGMPDVTHIIGDAVEFADLEFLVANTPPDVLLTGGSALAMPLPQLLDIGSSHANPDPRPGPRAIVLSGSCSQMTRQQVAHYIENNPSYQLLPETLDEATIRDCIQWIRSTEQNDTPLVYATASPDAVKATQTSLGVAEAGALVERAMALIAQAAFEIGVRRFVVAGGETSGAVTQSLGVSEVIIGREICPGVPWVFNRFNEEVVGLALKSGNFGSPSFFSDALALLGD